MPYVGNKPEVGNFRKCDAITTSATATYNLLVGGVAVNPNQNQCIVSLNGVIQSSGNSYTIASSQITFASTLASSDVIDFILILGDTLDAGVPSDDTVDASKITANVITGQTALGAIPADTDELLISDAGTLKRVDYSYLKSSVVNRPNAKPIIINGDMAVAQRDTSVTGITGDGYKLCDRWYEYLSSLGTYTFTQEAQSIHNPAGGAGFRQAFRIDCTTADASPSASDEFWFGMKFEGQDLQLIKKGSSNAEKLTLAFWVKSNKTGTGQVNFRDTDNGRMCSGTYTISSADTWEHKIINIAADTSGAFTDDYAESLQIQWYLDSGSNYEGGAAPTAWEAESATDRNASGTLNIGDNTANDWSITGVQLEVGEYTSSTLPPFQHETYSDSLTRCHRYYEELANQTYSMVFSCYAVGTAYLQDSYRAIKRTTPTITFTATGVGGLRAYAGGSEKTLTNVTSDNRTANAVSFQINGTSSPFTIGQAGHLNNTSAGGYYTADAEL